GGAASAAESPAGAGGRGNPAMPPDPAPARESPAPDSPRQISSAVIGKIGPISRAGPPAMTNIAVCADRRSRDRAANVYRRSLEMSLYSALRSTVVNAFSAWKIVG